MYESLFQSKTDYKPQEGSMLIASPQLQDVSFSRSVVYLCHHDENESVGYVVNKPSHYDLSFILKDVIRKDFPLYIGGPVDLESLHFIHNNPAINKSKKVSEHTYWSGDIDQVITLINSQQIEPHEIKFFLGYSGWGKNQLADEIETESWLVFNPPPNLIFDTSPKLVWKKSIEHLGNRYKHFLHFPIDPISN
ncbi:MAG: YqgE/AlgH family protein [Chitinophagaceae bacterium]